MICLLPYQPDLHAAYQFFLFQTLCKLSEENKTGKTI